MPIKLYNTLSKKKEVFKPIKKGQVGMYSCGPTVYNYQHIGNLRTAIFNDLLKRSLQYLGYKVKHVMNITDVDDKTIRESAKQGMSLKAFTRIYESAYLKDLQDLNIILPSKKPRATENINAMITMISSLLKKGYAYKTEDGIYFSIKKSKGYGKLAGLKSTKKVRSRITNDEYSKKNAQDFALWKFHNPKEDGPNFWNASFGKGRPGWHIECSAMSSKELGKTFDIHTGGQDLIFPHHTNEIAQSEAANNKKFVKYWMHGAMLSMKEKMSKSLGNIITLQNLKDSGYEAMHYRYLTLQTHYRKPLHYTYENLDSAKSAYEKLKRKILQLKKQSHKGLNNTKIYESAFQKALEDDLNIPKALQIFLKVLDDFDIDSKKKLSLLKKFDKVLGLNIDSMKESRARIPEEIKQLLKKRQEAREAKNYAQADEIRNIIKELGFLIEDSEKGPKLTKI